MTYTHKLSRRLAMLRTVAWTSIALLGACDEPGGPDALGPSEDSSLTRGWVQPRISITPDSQSVSPGQRAVFKAFYSLSKTDSSQIKVTWSSTGGTIDSNGTFSSSQAGRFKVIGSVKRWWRPMADTSTVIVSAPSSPSTQIVVTPDTATVPMGKSRTFTAIKRLSDGTVQSVGITWKATGGTIDGAGRYKADSAAGRYRVIASTTDGASDTAQVTIPAPSGGSTPPDTTVPAPPAPQPPTPPAPPPAPVPSRIVLVPASASLTTGGSQQFAAYGKSSAGDSLAVSVTFSATGGTIGATGAYKAGTTAGSFRVIAVLAGGQLADTSSVTVTSPAPPPAPPPPPPPPSSGDRVGFYAAPNGSGSTCSQAAPCSLGTAIGKTGQDTVWVREGTYSGFTLNRSNAVVRAYPGERVRVNGSVFQMATNGVLWGLEVYSSNPVSAGQLGIVAKGVGTKLINNIVHDAGMSGIGMWWDTQGGELYGNIVYNNGTHDNLDHGIYFNNKAGPTKWLVDNVVFNNWAYGFHAYSPTTGELSDLSLEGNVAFGGHGTGAYVSADLMVGGSSVQRLRVTDMYTYKPDGYTSSDLGYVGGGAQNGSVTVTGGYFVGSPGLQLNRWSSVSKTGDTEINFGSKPSSGTVVAVRPNLFEPGRGHVIVYNWGQAGSVSVNLSEVLVVGRAYKIHNVCDLYGSPIASGTYNGGSVSLTMASMPAPAFIGRSPRRAPPDCGGRFAVFLVEPN